MNAVLAWMIHVIRYRSALPLRFLIRMALSIIHPSRDVV